MFWTLVFIQGTSEQKFSLRKTTVERHRLLQGRQIQPYSIQWDSLDAQYMFCDIRLQAATDSQVLDVVVSQVNTDERWGFRGNIRKSPSARTSTHAPIR